MIPAGAAGTLRGMKTSRVRFENEAGHTLAGDLDMPERHPRAYALFAHCFTCGKNLTAVRRVSEQLTAEGIALLRFDFTGLGDSEGDFADTSFYTNLLDLKAAADYLAREHTAPAALVGHSLGGAAVLAVAGSIPSARCVATIGAPADTAHIRHLLAGVTFDDEGKAQVLIGGRPFTIGKEFFEDLANHDLLEQVAALHRALLVFHSPVDAVVGIENAERIFTAARHPRSFISLGNADHLLSNKHDAALVGHVLSAWASRYIDA